MYFYSILFSFFLKNLLPNKVYMNECDDWSEKHIFNSTEYHFLNSTFPFVRIDSMEDLKLNFSCKKIDWTRETLLHIFVNNNNVLFESDLNLTNVLGFFSRTKQAFLFQNIKGFMWKNLSKTKHVNKLENPIEFEFNFFNVNFDFYQNETHLIAEENCNSQYFNPNMTSFFVEIRNLVLLDNAYYNQNICPYVFMNAKLKILKLFGITNSLIFKNRLNFVDINEITNLSKVLSNIFLYEMNIAYETVTLKNLNKHVFKNVINLIIKGIIDGLDRDLFRNFQKIQMISIVPENFKSFTHVGIEWIQALNNKLNVNVDNYIEFKKFSKKIITVELIDQLSSLQSAYTYPDSDFCIFKDFPHSQLIAPVIILATLDIECSCTLIWLHKYWPRYHLRNKNVDYNDYPSFIILEKQKEMMSKNVCLKDKNFSSLIKACNFTQMSNKCLKQNIPHLNINLLQGGINLLFLVKWLQYIIEVFLRPILCFIGLITNFLTLKVIRNKMHVKNLKSPMYKHIQFNAMFNICFCFIFSFSLMNICIFPKSSFCSSVLKDEASQYIKIYLIYFLGNTFRLCCNFSYISFFLSRFISTVSSNQSKLKKWNEKLNIKLFYLIIFIMSLLLSIFKIFENRPNEVYNTIDNNFPFNAFDVKYCHLGIAYFPDKNCNIFWTLNLINNTLNNISFLFISIVIDILMIRFSNKFIKEKRAINSPHLDEAIEFKAKLNKMIITYETLFILAHFPEFVSTLLLIIFKKTFSEFCHYYFSCFELIEMAQTFHFISIGFQFFIFLIFDHNFSRSCHDLFKNIFKMKT
jgi:hypothetical protein